MKLEQFIIQDGAGYEFTGEFRIPDASEDYWMDPDTVKIVHGDLATYCYRRLIYKLIAPKTVYYKKEGDAYKFTGRIGIATVDEYFLDDKGRMLRGMLFRQDKDYPVYTLLAQKHTEGPSKQDAPPPFIKQGEDYFLYVKTAQVNKGDWYYSTNGNMLNQSVIGGLKVERPIYEKLPLTLIQDDVQYVFTGEYRKVSKDEYYYYYHSKKIYKYEGQFAAESESSFPIYITFEDFYYKKYPAMDAAGKEYAKTPIDELFEWTKNKMSGVAIQKLQAARSTGLTPAEMLELWEHWTKNYPILSYGFVDSDKCPKYQEVLTHWYDKVGQFEKYKQHKLTIMTIILENLGEYQHPNPMPSYSGYILEGIHHRYQRRLSFQELKELKVQLVHRSPLLIETVNPDSPNLRYYFSAINYRILE